MHPEGKTCPAVGKTCSLCAKKNHFAQCCKSKSSRSVNEVHDQLSSDGSDFFVETITTGSNSNQALTSLLLGPKQVPIQFKFDTGSHVNVIPERLFNQLQYFAPLEQPERHLSAYTGDKLDVRGRCTLKCQYKEQDSELCRKHTVLSNPWP